MRYEIIKTIKTLHTHRQRHQLKVMDCYSYYNTLSMDSKRGTQGNGKT